MASVAGVSIRTMVRLVFAAIVIGILAVQISGLTATSLKPKPVKPAARPAPAVAAAVPKPIPGPATLPADGPFVVKRILTLDEPLRHGGYHWDAAGAPAGPIVITIDLAAETLSVFRGGYEIGVAAVLYGAPEKPSPLGQFRITQKKKDHISTLYDAPMPYMLRLTDDGVAIHGSVVERNAATHGCIGVPLEFARLLFGQARLGDRVIITRGKMLQLGQKITGA